MPLCCLTADKHPCTNPPRALPTRTRPRKHPGPLPRVPRGHWPPCKITLARLLSSDRFLQCRHCESLHDGLGRLCLHHHHLPEDLTLARLRRRLHTCLDHAHTWDRALPSLLHLPRRHAREGVQDLRHLCFLQLC